MTSVEEEEDLGDIEVPARLKCTICGQLARDAYKLPCCESSICDQCK